MSTIQITVKLFAQYREGNFKVEKRLYKEPLIVKDVIVNVKIDTDKYPIGVLMVNGRHVDEEYFLKDEDTLSIFPKVGGG